MTIHHSQIKKAERMGVQLSEDGDSVIAFWPKRALKIHGSSAVDAMAQMQAAQAIMGDDTMRVVPDDQQPRLVDIHHSDGTVLKGGPMPPVAAHKLVIMDRKGEWVNPEEGGDYVDEEPRPETDKVERINGIATNGAIAYAEGTPAGDCPYSSEEDADEYDDFVRWNDEWDNAADESQEDKGTGTVVAEKYRAKYAEAGHPTHCGDWLAETLNNICQNKGGTNLELFEDICKMNGVDTSKYKRSGVGWEGRLRMTGRNLMAKKVFQRGGILVLPETINGGSMRAPAEWMETRSYKKPAPVEPTGETIAVKTAA